MKTAYYKASVEVSLALRSEWKTKGETGDKMQKDLCDAYGVDRVLEQGGRIVGLAIFCKSLADDPWAKKHGDRIGLKLDHLREDGKLFAIYKPHMGRKKHRAMFDAVNEERSENPMFLSDFLVKKFGLGRLVLNKGRFWKSIGWIPKPPEGVIVLRVPYEMDWEEYGEDHKKPESIEGFVQIKKSEFIALTEDEEL